MPVYKDNAMNRKMGRVGKEHTRYINKMKKMSGSRPMSKAMESCCNDCAMKKPARKRLPRKKNIKMIAGNPVYINPRMKELKR